MIKLIDNGKTNFFFDEYNMMLDRNESWNKFGQGDSLWRTSLAYLARDIPEIELAIIECFQIEKDRFRIYRHPLDLDDDTSRDQVIMVLVALKERNPEWHEDIKNFLSFRISKKFTWQDAWFWAKENYLLWRISSFYHFIGWWFEPSYSIHLFCWMVWSSKQRMRLIKWYLLKFIVPKTNYLLRALLSDKFNAVDWFNIHELKPMIDFRWQRDTPWLQGRELTEDESQYNTLDIDVLYYVLSTL